MNMKKLFLALVCTALSAVAQALEGSQVSEWREET